MAGSPGTKFCSKVVKLAARLKPARQHVPGRLAAAAPPVASRKPLIPTPRAPAPLQPGRMPVLTTAGLQAVQCIERVFYLTHQQLDAAQHDPENHMVQV